MKRVQVFNASGDMIEACAADVDYYATIGWKPKARTAAVKTVQKETD
jgi:hypothetical protein